MPFHTKKKRKTGTEKLREQLNQARENNQQEQQPEQEQEQQPQTQPTTPRSETELARRREAFRLARDPVEEQDLLRERRVPEFEALREQRELEQQQPELERRRERAEELGEQDLLPPEEAPERVELDIDPRTGERIPVVGTLQATIGNTIATYLKDLPGLKSFVGEGQEIDSLIQTPEGRRGVMIAEIQREELDKSISATEAVGAISESLGLNKLPFEIGTFVDKFTKTPSKDVNTLRQRINSIETRASGLTDAAAQGELGNGVTIAKQLREMDLEIAKIEAQIKLASSISAELRSDPEQVNLIEEEILKTRLTIFEAQQRVAEGIIITKPEENLFMQLKEAKNES